MQKLGIGAAIGAAMMWFLDPSAGRRRRALIRDRTLALFRRGARKAERAGGAVAAEAYGVAQKATHLREEPKEYNDETLKSKVESELFRAEDAPKGQVAVNAQNGVVQLRGEVGSPELIDELVQRARSVQGVQDVENLLHLPDTEAPMHQ
jgi:osmotically-inducible protein OsmY